MATPYSDAVLDRWIDGVLKASGSALKHYSMQKTKDDMRAAMRQALDEAEALRQGTAGK